MQQIVEHFGAQQGVKLAIRAGIDTGTVSSGLVGRSKVVYDLWGDAVSLAFRLQGGANEAGIFVTQRVVDKIADSCRSPTRVSSRRRAATSGSGASTRPRSTTTRSRQAPRPKRATRL